MGNEINNNFQAFKNWQTVNLQNDVLRDKYIEFGADASIMNGIHDDVYKTYGTINFMEGKDASEYDSQIASLALGELNEKDKDGDGKLSGEELALDGAGYGVINDVSLFHIVDQVMGNGDGSLDKSEIETYYKNLDNFADSDGVEAKDGKFEYNKIEEYSDYLINQVTNANYEKMEEWLASKDRDNAYDFMDGYDANNPKSYIKQTLRLGQTTIKSLDKNNDGVLTQDEYDKEKFDFDFKDLDFLNKGYIDKYDMGAYWEFIDTNDEDGKNGKIYISKDKE